MRRPRLFGGFRSNMRGEKASHLDRAAAAAGRGRRASIIRTWRIRWSLRACDDRHVAGGKPRRSSRQTAGPAISGWILDGSLACAARRAGARRKRRGRPARRARADRARRRYDRKADLRENVAQSARRTWKTGVFLGSRPMRRSRIASAANSSPRGAAIFCSAARSAAIALSISWTGCRTRPRPALRPRPRRTHARRSGRADPDQGRRSPPVAAAGIRRGYRRRSRDWSDVSAGYHAKRAAVRTRFSVEDPNGHRVTHFVRQELKRPKTTPNPASCHWSILRVAGADGPLLQL